MSDIKNWGYWYLAQPYSGDEEANYQEGVERLSRLMSHGLLVFSPIVHAHPPSLIMPPQKDEWWYEYDHKIIWVGGFTGIILPPLWDTSVGCVKENRWFTEYGKKCILYADMLTALVREDPSCL